MAMFYFGLGCRLMGSTPAAAPVPFSCFSVVFKIKVKHGKIVKNAISLSAAAVL